MAHYYRLRRATPGDVFVYLLGTVLITGFLGWHHVADVAAGLAIALAALALGLLTVYPRLARHAVVGSGRMRR